MGDVFRPIGALADAEVLRLARRCGRCAVRVVLWLREDGGVRTLPELCDDLQVPSDDLLAALIALEAAGLIHHRDLIMDSHTEPCWWAPRVVFPGGSDSGGAR